MKQVKFSALALFCALLQTTAFSQSQNAGKTVSDYFASVDAGNLDAVGPLLTEDFSATAPFSPVPFDKMTWRGVGQGFKTAFPDMKHEVVDWFANGNKVAVQGIFRGTNTGPNMGNPATGNKVNCPFSTLFELDGNGRIKSLNTQFDMKLFETQLMAGLPDPGTVAESMMAELNKGNLDGVLVHCAADARFHGWGPQPLDGAGYRQAMSGILASFPDARFPVLDVVADGDKVVVRHQLEGTHTGTAFQGIAKSDRKVVVPATVIFRFRDGKAAELWLNADMLGLLMQLGANPMAGK